MNGLMDWFLSSLNGWLDAGHDVRHVAVGAADGLEDLLALQDIGLAVVALRGHAD